MAVILRKMRNKPIQKETEKSKADWKHLIALLKLMFVLFAIFSVFHWIIMKKVHHLPVNSYPTPMYSSRQTAGSFEIYTVKSGDTLWSIANRYPNKNPAQMIKEIKLANGLTSDVIQPGQPIKIPTK